MPKGTGPTINRHRSRQDYRTPPEFLDAIERRYELTFGIDLAATKENRVCAEFISPERDALSFPNWSGIIPPDRWGWLNPPFGTVLPWAQRCARTLAEGGEVALLVPAAVGSVWFHKWVWGWAHVVAFRPRLTFVGEADPYPKDLLLCLYRRPYSFAGGDVAGFETWNWKRQQRPAR